MLHRPEPTNERVEPLTLYTTAIDIPRSTILLLYIDNSVTPPWKWYAYVLICEKHYFDEFFM